MKIEVDTVKGFQDYLPPESLKKRAVKAVVEKYYKLYGFVPVETPFIEFDEMMRPDSPKEEDEAVSDRFRLQDRAGRNLGLRYEFTFQLARIFKQNPNIKLPFRRYQIGENFRDEPIGAGRFRQFIQCDADIIGDSSVEADVECLSLVSDILKELKIDAEVCINNRKLLNAIIDSVQATDKRNIMRELDKIDKLGEDAVKSNLRRFAEPTQIMTLFKLFEKDLQFFVENEFDGAKEVKDILDRCRSYGIKNAKFMPFLARGFSYYTGNIFEVRVKEQKNVIAAGGRYDKVVGKYIGNDIPAVGISFGVERLSELAQINVEKTQAIIISIGQDSKALKLVKLLRGEGVSCILTSDKPGKAMEYANSYNILNAIFIGDEEASKNKFKVRNMKSGEERLLGEKSLINLLKKSR
ncbi:MAG: histidine--tRNA ligase [archaeon]|nr:histidine--tRNA ligase [archaeon]